MAQKKTSPKKRPAKKTAAERAPEPKAAEPAAPMGVCPRCRTRNFAPEPRIRTEGSRTVRFTVLVCERGHTFVRPRPG